MLIITDWDISVLHLMYAIVINAVADSDLELGRGCSFAPPLDPPLECMLCCYFKNWLIHVHCLFPQNEIHQISYSPLFYDSLFFGNCKHPVITLD